MVQLWSTLRCCSLEKWKVEDTVIPLKGGKKGTRKKDDTTSPSVWNFLVLRVETCCSAGCFMDVTDKASVGNVLCFCFLLFVFFFARISIAVEIGLSVRVKRFHLDANLAQQSGQATVSPAHLLGASDGSEHFLLVSEQGGSDLVQLGNVVHDGEDVSLAGGVGRLHADAASLAGVEVAGGFLENGLLVTQGGGSGLLFGRQFSLGLLQLIL